MHPVKQAGALALDEERVRRWLANLRRPERLDDPVMRDLLRAYGRAPTGASLEVGRAAAALLRDAIEALRPPEGATAGEQLPHVVLRTCFVDGAKSYQAAGRLGLSERQLSRERARAISLLTAWLAAVPGAGAGGASPPPAPGAAVRREGSRTLSAALAASRRVHVWGPPGTGKTTLVAAHAHACGAEVVWLTVMPALNAELRALLFDLGSALARDEGALDAYLRRSLPEPDLGLATRIALAALAGRDRLLVVDDFDGVADDAAVTGFLGEAAARLPRTRVVTIGRNPLAGAGARHVRVRRFTRRETAGVLAAYGIRDDVRVAGLLQRWTRGSPRLVDGAARFLAAATPSEAAAAARALRADTRAPEQVLHACAGLVSGTRARAA